eukprot:EG_transcript_8708
MAQRCSRRRILAGLNEEQIAVGEQPALQHGNDALSPKADPQQATALQPPASAGSASSSSTSAVATAPISSRLDPRPRSRATRKRKGLCSPGPVPPPSAGSPSILLLNSVVPASPPGPPSPEAAPPPPTGAADRGPPAPKRPRQRQRDGADLRPPAAPGTRHSHAQGQLQELLALLKGGDVLALVGAGISTSAGLPDFRSASGVFPMLKRKYPLLVRPEDVFHLNCFDLNPQPFLEACQALMRTDCAPTPTHQLLRELDRQGMLFRVYTQNIDGLEFKADIPREKVVQMHGSFERAHCTRCHAEVDAAVVRGDVEAGRLSPCSAPGCGGRVKPDVILYGEDLPVAFQAQVQADFERCQVLLVMGTSLNADPAKKMVNSVAEDVRRVFLNRDKQTSKRSGDVVITGECDALARALLGLLGADRP